MWCYHIIRYITYRILYIKYLISDIIHHISYSTCGVARPLSYVISYSTHHISYIIIYHMAPVAQRVLCHMSYHISCIIYHISYIILTSSLGEWVSRTRCCCCRRPWINRGVWVYIVLYHIIIVSYHCYLVIYRITVIYRAIYYYYLHSQQTLHVPARRSSWLDLVPQASGSAGSAAAAGAPGTPELYECSVCKRKLANSAFDRKNRQKIWHKKRRQGSRRCCECRTADCGVVHALVCAACAS